MHIGWCLGFQLHCLQEAGTLAGWQADPDALAKVTVPVLYLRGNDEELSEESMQSLLGMFPNSQTDFKVLRPSGAFPHIDAHNAYIERQEKLWA